MSKILRVGIVGANPDRGWAKDAHIPALMRLPELKITAVSARNQTIADAAAKAFGAALAFADSIALTQSPSVDIVAVTVKVPEHYAIVMSALKAGKHVYCEWPLGRDIQETTEMAATARDAGVHVMIGLQGTAAPAVLHARELIDNGEIGRPLTLRVFSPTAGWAATAPAFYGYLSDKSTGATLTSIAGGHTLALMSKLVGRFTEVDARSSILHPQVRILENNELIERTCADHLLVLGKHTSECVSTLEVAGGQSKDTPFTLELTGSKGVLRLTSNHPGGFQVGNMTLEVNGQAYTNLLPAIPGIVGAPSNVGELYSRFIKDIHQDTFTVPDFEEAVRLTVLLEAIERASAGSRQQVK